MRFVSPITCLGAGRLCISAYRTQHNGASPRRFVLIRITVCIDGQPLLQAMQSAVWNCIRSARHLPSGPGRYRRKQRCVFWGVRQTVMRIVRQTITSPQPEPGQHHFQADGWLRLAVTGDSSALDTRDRTRVFAAQVVSRVPRAAQSKAR